MISVDTILNLIKFVAPLDEWRNNKKRRKSFDKVRKLMPDLINEMFSDLKTSSDIREFVILPSKYVVFQSGGRKLFYYYEDEHPSLRSHINVLEREGFIFDTTETKTPKYQLEEEFVKLLS